MNVRLTVLGTRGSIPVSGPEFAEFGCATSCYLLEVDDYSILLDAGNGLLHASTDFARPPVILLTHLHIDHIIGLGMFARIFMKGAKTTVYVPAQEAQTAHEQLERLYCPPLWPIKLTDGYGDLEIEEMPLKLQVGPIAIDAIEGQHPGGCLVYRLSAAGKTLVYATDYEYEPASFERLVDVCRKADLVLYDAQYDDEAYEAHRGFGHSTPERGLELLQRSEARQMLFVHHDPQANDVVLRARERSLDGMPVRYAREGEVIEL